MESTAQLLQALFAALALFIAPGAAFKVYRRLTRRIRVICEPRLRRPPASIKTYNPVEIYRRLRAVPTAAIGQNYARIWHLWFENGSTTMFDLRIFVLTDNQPNWVRAVAVHALEDSGLKANSSLNGGMLTIVAERFHRSRILPVSIVLKSPDRPIFESSVGEVLSRYQLKRSAHEIFPSRVLFVQHERLMFLLIWYFGMIAMVMARLIWIFAFRP